MEIEAPNSTDARDWATFFVGVAKQHPEIVHDEGTMATWFANAIMKGYDHGVRVSREREVVFLRRIYERAEVTRISTERSLAEVKELSDKLKGRLAG
jgi:hypothetical protein